MDNDQNSVPCSVLILSLLLKLFKRIDTNSTVPGTAPELDSDWETRSKDQDYGALYQYSQWTDNLSGSWKDSGTDPDDGSGWTTLSTTIGEDSQTFSAVISGVIWGLKENQYLMFRAIIEDNAGNQKITDPMFVTILPGVDLSWDLTQLDRLIIRTGSGQVFTLTSTKNLLYLLIKVPANKLSVNLIKKI